MIDGSDLILFTGSLDRDGARRSPSGAAAQLKPVILELGGKHPMIVCADAALERAAAAAAWGALSNNGQVCVGVERVFVEAEVYDAEFVESGPRARRGPSSGTEPGPGRGARRRGFV